MDFGAVLCTAAGLVLLGIAVREGTVVQRLRRHGVRTWGVVVDNVRTRDNQGPKWIPVIAFTDRSGHRVEFSPRMQGAGLGLETGRQVEIVYLAQSPRVARVRMWRHVVGPVVFLVFGGVAFLGMGVVIALTS
ncbi:DUF3592 domain-containing protein [Streptomyces hyaluromycini]|uniref:DUF3592 domain-containing protein n=1 Tax=Streptomyces hyaluromycini TaxID=1377993 RepID=A0ABV1XDU3_9ACTN